MAETKQSPSRPRDAPARSFVDVMPPRARPYLVLMRADRPIGSWLLFWPCAFGLALAAPLTSDPWRLLWFALLFAVGAIVMRGAGCTYNDIVDRDIDAKVERTRGRPIPSGAVSVRNAIIFLVAQSLIGLVILLQFNAVTIWLGLASLLLIAAYPFMKRITFWPQAWLGIVFNWGALLGWTAVTGSIARPALLLYAGCVFWTLGYDTIYAHQDKEDDAPIGVKSTALLFGVNTKPWLVLFYALAIVLWALAALDANLALWFALALVALHLGWQIARFRLGDPVNALKTFRSNRETGALLTLALILGAMRF